MAVQKAAARAKRSADLKDAHLAVPLGPLELMLVDPKAAPWADWLVRLLVAS